MTAREYAQECGVVLIGKLTKKISHRKKWNAYKGDFVTESIISWIDEVGNEIIQGPKKGTWCIVTAEGGVC